MLWKVDGDKICKIVQEPPKDSGARDKTFKFKKNHAQPLSEIGPKMY